MNIRLSHYGWMVTRHLVNCNKLRLSVSPRNDLLLDLWTGLYAPYEDSLLEKSMLTEGMLILIDESISLEEVQLRYKRNPFEYVDKVIFEVTTFCNLDCNHCYNAHVPRLTEQDPHLLMKAADTFLQMGIRRFDFVGGEVSLYGKGWLDVASHIHAQDASIHISLYSNGWWLEREKFRTTGREYENTQSYLADLKAHGVSHVVFSIDGPGEEHDRSRHQSGLYEKILRGLDVVRQAGLTPHVSLLVRPDWAPAKREAFLAEIADHLYDFAPDLPTQKRALRLALDPTNSVSNFIDTGNGAGDSRIQFPILESGDYLPLYCRNFYRLSPSITIKANGELATCRLSQAGEGYGNIHERPLVEILNGFDQAFVFQLHVTRKLEEYLPLLDRSIFGSAFTHLCSLRSIVTLLARKIHEQHVSFDDSDAIRRINREVAMVAGYKVSK